MDVKEWFENGTGLKIKKLRYLKPPKLPYFLFSSEIENRGADLIINLQANNIRIERYSETDNESDFEEIQKVNDFLNKNNYEYEVQTDYLDEEKLYETLWILDPILEKIRKK